MTSILRRTLAALALTSTVWFAATAAAADDHETCIKESGDEAIAACTRLLIPDDKRPPACLLLTNRCAEWRDKRKTIKPLKIAAKRSSLIRRRGSIQRPRQAYRAKRQYDRAIEDMNKALRLSPNDADISTTAASRTMRKAKRPRHRGFERSDPAESGPRGCVLQPRQRLPAQGPARPRHRGFTQAIRLNPNYAMAFNNRAPPITPQANMTAPSRISTKRSGLIRTMQWRSIAAAYHGN